MYKILKLNLARNCLRYIIKMYNISELWLPYYTCETVWQAVRKENCSIKFYHIDKDFKPVVKFNKSDFILYTNYFGVCTQVCKLLAENYPNLIIDNSQSFYSEPLGLCCFNSLRKFFDVQNGAYLYHKNNIECNLQNDNLTLEIVNAQDNYNLFVKNELILNKQPILKISKNVEYKMTLIDFKKDKTRRIENFNKYKYLYDKYNNIKILLKGNDIPYCYPLNTNNLSLLNQLVEQNITLIKLWNKPVESFFYNTVALPI